MPPATPLVVAAAAKAAAAAAAKAAFWAAVKKFAVTALINLALSVAAQLLVGKPKISRRAQDVEYSGTIEARRIIYGKMLISGMNTIPPLTSGNNNEMLHQVLTIAGHECNSLGTVYFNRQAVGSISAVTGTADDGKVTGGTYLNRAWIRRYTGTDSQVSDYKLTSTFASWTTSHRGRGVAYIAMTFQYDEEVYKNGRPETTVLVEGKKVYDPRLDSTQPGGVGSQRVNDPTTYAYSTNPALCLADYLTDNRLGLGEDAARIDWALVADAADICDEVVSVPGTTQKRYTCNMVLNTGDRFEDNIEALAQTMMGVCYYSGGKWKMYAGAWRTPTFTLGVDDLIEGGVKLVTAFPYNQRYNSVRGTYIDPTQNWQQTEFRAVANQSYIAEDGEQAWLDTTFAGCTNEFEAQRNAILLNRRSRLAQAATLRCNLSAYNIEPFETGTVTIPELGWNAKEVRVEGWTFDPAGFIDLSVREETSAQWGDPINSDYIEPLTITTPTPSTYTPDPPTNLTVYGLQSSIYLTWSAPATLPRDCIFEVFEHTSSTPFSSATKVWSGNVTNAILVKTDTTTRYYWVRAKTGAGTASATEPPGAGLPGAVGVLPSALTVSASPSNIVKTDTGASITTASTTVTAVGGTTPYTYAWTRIAGSTSISADSPAAATTTFTGSSLVSGTTYDATFRCTVTDSAGTPAVKTVDVTVRIVRAAMTATASPGSLYKVGIASSQTTSSTTVTVTGGVSPYTYSWSKVSGDTLTVDSPTAATTTFTATGLVEGDSRDATYRCTVTDSTGGTPLTATADVLITIERAE
jgi:hypothetical protein